MSNSSWNKHWRYALVGSLTFFTLMIPISIFMLPIGAVLILITIIGKKLTDRKFVIVVPPFTWLILFFLLIAVVSLIFSPYPTPPETWGSLRKLRFFGYYFLLFFGIYESRESGGIKFPIIGFLVGCTFASLLAWGQYWIGNEDIVTFFNPDIMASPFVEEKFRAIGFMSHHRRFSMVIGLALPIVASLLIHLRQGWWFKSLYVFLIILFSGALLWTQGRGIIIAIIFSTILVFLLRSWKLAVMLLVGIFMVGIILVFTIPKDIYWISPKFFFSVSEGVLNESLEDQLDNPIVKSSNDIRVILWRIGVDSFLKHPILGIGWGQFKHEREKIDAAILNADKYPHNHPHSELLWIAVELGIFGLFVFVFFWGSLLFRLGAAYKRREGLTQIVKALLFTGIWCALFWIISGLTDVSLLNSENSAALWFVLGLSSYALYMKKRPQEVKL